MFDHNVWPFVVSGLFAFIVFCCAFKPEWLFTSAKLYYLSELIGERAVRIIVGLLLTPPMCLFLNFGIQRVLPPIPVSYEEICRETNTGRRVSIEGIAGSVCDKKRCLYSGLRPDQTPTNVRLRMQNDEDHIRLSKGDMIGPGMLVGRPEQHSGVCWLVDVVVVK